MNIKYSYKWLQSYFSEPLPVIEKIAELLTNHSFEVESTDTLPGGDIVIELSILPNRTHDALGHFFLAKEIGMLIGKDPVLPEWKEVERRGECSLTPSILNSKLCLRYRAEEVRNVTVSQSPTWLAGYLENVGQKSINNLVDAANFITFSVNQPVHIFDKDKLKGNIKVRLAEEGEDFETLDGKTLTLSSDVLVIADDLGPVALAGIKGGKRAEVTDSTKNILIESANFNARYVRKISGELGIKTDASRRFENEIAPSLVPLASELLVSLVQDVAGGIVSEYVDLYPRPSNPYKVGLPIQLPQKLLGVTISEEEIEGTLNQLRFSYTKALSLKEVLENTSRLLGKPYLFGASVTKDAPRGFDCSSLVSYLYAEAGVWLPRISVDQMMYGETVEKASMMPGDLIFSNTGEGKIHIKTVEYMPGTAFPSGVDHVGMYVGEGQVLHATSGRGVVAEVLAESDKFKNIVSIRRYVSPEEMRLVVNIPDERIDLRIKEDLVEEIGRIRGYDQVPLSLLPNIVQEEKREVFPVINFIREFLVRAGFSEVYGYAFNKKGKREVTNPLQSDKPFLQEELINDLSLKLEQNLHWVDLFGKDSISLFEIDTVFTPSGEELHLALGSITRNKKEKSSLSNGITEVLGRLSETLGVTFEGARVQEIGNSSVIEVNLESHLELLSAKSWPKASLVEITKTYVPISPFPYITRDVSFFLPNPTQEGELIDILKKEAGPLCVRAFLFDRFEKKEGENKILSLAYRFVFQSNEKTLTDLEVAEIFTHVTKKLESLDAIIR
jgi:phenylalanyl-tRNA synthetase beta subunit